MWLRFCHRIKCKMETIVPIVEMLQSTISEIKRHPHSTVTFRRCVIAMDWVKIFAHDQGRFSQPEWSEAGGIPEGDLRPFPSTVHSPVTVHFPSPPPPSLLPAPTIEFLFRDQLILFISISSQRAVVYLSVPLLDFYLSGQICSCFYLLLWVASITLLTPRA